MSPQNPSMWRLWVSKDIPLPETQPLLCVRILMVGLVQMSAAISFTWISENDKNIEI